MHELSLKLQEFFFEAALATYAGSAKKTTIEGLPRSKVYRYERKEYLYIDTYFTNGEQSGGQTVIYVKRVKFVEKIPGVSVPEEYWLPSWIMQYHGWCEGDNKEVLDFLKEVLSRTYRTRTFCGGRGKLFGEVNSARCLEYANNWTGTFDYFSGEERISKEDVPEDGTGLETRDVFWHRYQGMTLLQEVQQEN